MSEFMLTTILSSRDHSAQVHVEFDGKTLTQMDANTARELAMNFLQCAEAADQDAMVWGLLRSSIGVDENVALGFIREMRDHRGGTKQ